MHPLILPVLAILSLPSVVAGQNVTIGCGDPAQVQATLEEFGPLFTSADPDSARFRVENNLRQVNPGEIVAVPDSATCVQLANRATDLLRAVAWDYWSSAQWETSSIRVGPYYYVYVGEVPAPGTVGSGTYEFVLDAATLEEIPTPYSRIW
jgi:hypothetical protein